MIIRLGKIVASLDLFEVRRLAPFPIIPTSTRFTPHRPLLLAVAERLVTRLLGDP
jgi:hypothetical protein